MTNQQINIQFFAVTDAATRARILNHIALNYGTTTAEIYEELTGEDAEHFLDYMTGAERSAAYLIYQRHGFTL